VEILNGAGFTLLKQCFSGSNPVAPTFLFNLRERLYGHILYVYDQIG